MNEYLEQKLANFITMFNTNKLSGKKNSLRLCVNLFSTEIIEIIQRGYKYSDIYDYLNLKSQRKISKGHFYETIKILRSNTNTPIINTNVGDIQPSENIFSNLNSNNSKKTIEHNSMHIFNKK